MNGAVALTQLGTETVVCWFVGGQGAMLDPLQLILIHGSAIPGPHALLFLEALQFTFTTRHIYHWCHCCFCPAASFFLKLLVIDLYILPWFNSWVREMSWRRDRLPTPIFLGFPGSSAGKESTCNVGDLGSLPGLGRSPGEGKGYPLQHSALENCSRT